MRRQLFAIFAALAITGSTSAKAACHWWQTEMSCIQSRADEIEREDAARMIVHFRDVLRSSAAPEPRRESVNDRLRRRIREQNWAARCKPTEFKDTNGVVHLKYAAQGCDRGPDPDIDAVKADDSTVAVKP